MISSGLTSAHHFVGRFQAVLTGAKLPRLLPLTQYCPAFSTIGRGQFVVNFINIISNSPVWIQAYPAARVLGFNLKNR